MKKVGLNDVKMLLWPFRSVHHQYVLFNVHDETRIFHMIYKTLLRSKTFLFDDHHRRLLIFASQEQWDFLNSAPRNIRCKCFYFLEMIFLSRFNRCIQCSWKQMTISVVTFAEQTYEELCRIVKQHVERKSTIDLSLCIPRVTDFCLFFPSQTM